MLCLALVYQLAVGSVQTWQVVLEIVAGVEGHVAHAQLQAAIAIPVVGLQVEDQIDLHVTTDIVRQITPAEDDRRETLGAAANHQPQVIVTDTAEIEDAQMSAEKQRQGIADAARLKCLQLIIQLPRQLALGDLALTTHAAL